MAFSRASLATNMATNLATNLAENLGAVSSAGWLTVPGYAALFETVAPSSIAVSGTDVTSWTDSTANFTGTPRATENPTFPGTQSINGLDALYFDDDSLEISLGIASTDTYAIYFVVRPDTVTTHTLFVSMDSGGTEQIGFRLLTGGVVQHMRNGLVSRVSPVATYSGATWTRLMFAYDGTNSIMRVEGAAEETAAIAAGSHDSGDSLFGKRDTVGQALTGHFALAAIYGGASGVPSNSTLRSQAWADIGTRFGL